MPAITRQGDLNTGHDSFPPVSLDSGSPNVFINSIPCGRQGDSYPPHVGSVPPSEEPEDEPLTISEVGDEDEGEEDESGEEIVSHSGSISGGSSTVFVNGKPIARVGDSVSCGGTVAQGSPNVYAN